MDEPPPIEPRSLTPFGRGPPPPEPSRPRGGRGRAGGATVRRGRGLRGAVRSGAARGRGAGPPLLPLAPSSI